MKLRPAFAATALLLTPALLAQSMGEAGDDGEAFAKQIRDATNAAILESGAENEVPNFEGTEIPGTDYLGDPDGLTSAGEAARYDPDYQVVIDPYRTRFDPATIDLSAATTIANDPDAFLGSGFSADGTQGTCEPVPGGGATDTEYLESCNAGSQPYDEARSCRAPLNVQTEGSNYWEYQCFTEFEKFTTSGRLCDAIERDPEGGSCTITDSEYVGETCLQWGMRNGIRWCTEPGDPIYRNTYSCPSELSVPGGIEKNTIRIVSETIDETMCQAAVDGADCSLDNSVCTSPNETRIIDGLSVTRHCWEWERSYICQGVRPANDCGELDKRDTCSFAYDECLSENADGSCNVTDRWYRCTAPGGGAEEAPAYICAQDLYCLGGECTQIEREASTEFKDAMVAVQAMGEIRNDFDADSLTLFGGDNLKCTKKLFGISNCCSGKGVPLITPFLCNSEDRDVDKKDDEGLCHKVGTYCSDKVLGVCVTKKQSYCCFSSKLVRILQVQGREQLGMPWGEAKTPDCKGFLVEQFQQLDLSLMDFSEVYAEFVDAAKIPDEIETSLLIQQRIDEYFDLHGGG